MLIIASALIVGLIGYQQIVIQGLESKLQVTLVAHNSLVDAVADMSEALAEDLEDVIDYIEDVAEHVDYEGKEDDS